MVNCERFIMCLFVFFWWMVMLILCGLGNGWLLMFLFFGFWMFNDERGIYNVIYFKMCGGFFGYLI